MKEIADTYQLLSICFHDPDPRWLGGLKVLEPFQESLREASVEDLRREKTRLLSLTVAGGISPYETEYGGKEIFFKTDRLSDIAGFYRAFGMDIKNNPGERHDFIGAELELMAWLIRKEERAMETGRTEEVAVCREAQEHFMLDHLGRWAPFFGDTLARSARHPFYRDVGGWLVHFVQSECRRLGVTPDRVTAWEPVSLSSTEFTCGADDPVPTPQPLTVIR